MPRQNDKTVSVPQLDFCKNCNHPKISHHFNEATDWDWGSCWVEDCNCQKYESEPISVPTESRPTISAERLKLAIERVRQEISIYDNAQADGVLDCPSHDFLEDLKILSDYDRAERASSVLLLNATAKLIYSDKGTVDCSRCRSRVLYGIRPLFCANCGVEFTNWDTSEAKEWAVGRQPDEDAAWHNLQIGHWFVLYSPNCVERYSVQERTSGGCTLICSTPWHHESARRDMQEIAKSHNAKLASLPVGESSEYEEIETCSQCGSVLGLKGDTWEVVANQPLKTK